MRKNAIYVEKHLAISASIRKDQKASLNSAKNLTVSVAILTILVACIVAVMTGKDIYSCSFDKLMFWGNMENGKILHFAPEGCLPNKISEQAPSEYVKADLYPINQDIRKIDATAIPFSDDTFDLLIANHILEHIQDYRKALSEFYRILKPGGIAILQTPYSRLLRNNFEDDGIDSDELRLFFHGQEDHVRTFGEHQFLKSLEEAGFSLQIKKHEAYFDASSAYYYGVNINEDLIMLKKITE